jgi:lactate dehydrogenase-like 2-hydroxyacid dehydrogenase
MSVGYDNVDIATATKLGIPVSNTPGVLSKATAETAFLLMIAAARKAFYLHRKILQGQWHSFDPFANLGTELYGATLGVFGLGSIGYEMAKRCKAVYGMKIIYHNRTHNQKAEEALGALKVSFEELLQQSDVISLHAALTAETKNKFDRAAFSQMKRNAIFINTARGAMHNEQDLIVALNEGTIWGAGLDVTNPEPMDKNNPLLLLPTVAVLPHIGSATVKTRHAMAQLAVDNVIAGLRGQHLPQIVNKAVYENG